MQGEHKKYVALLVTSATRADFCMKFYTTVKQENILKSVHFVAKFC